MSRLVAQKRAPRAAFRSPQDSLPASSVELTGLSPVKSTLDRQRGASGVSSTHTVDIAPFARTFSLGAPFFGPPEVMA